MKLAGQKDGYNRRKNESIKDIPGLDEESPKRVYLTVPCIGHEITGKRSDSNGSKACELSPSQRNHSKTRNGLSTSGSYKTGNEYHIFAARLREKQALDL